jgi:pilin isopeptide linkage protein
MINNLNAPVPSANVDITIAKNPVGTQLIGQEFEFALFDEIGTQVSTAKNDAQGLIKFPTLHFSIANEYKYSIKEISAPSDWIMDTMVYPVDIDVVAGGPTGFVVSVSYPNGIPGFINYYDCGESCGKIQFPKITYDKAGDYEYTLREITPSGGGWKTDSKVYDIIVHVIDDGYGNLVATIEYPDDFPVFTNTYSNVPTSVILSACKICLGADLPCGKFEFGLFDQDGKEIAIATNESA